MATTAAVSDDLLLQMAQVIVQEVEPERIILFGSHARGEARPDSDVDLLVIEQEGFGKQRSRRREAALLWRALAHFPVPKEIGAQALFRPLRCFAALPYAQIWEHEFQVPPQSD
jgi:predicted nucleotidyltransferase